MRHVTVLVLCTFWFVYLRIYGLLDSVLLYDLQLTEKKATESVNYFACYYFFFCVLETDFSIINGIFLIIVRFMCFYVVVSHIDPKYSDEKAFCE